MESSSDLHFLPFGRNMNILSQIRTLKIVQTIQQWLINVSEELDAKSGKLDTGTSLNKF